MGCMPCLQQVPTRSGTQSLPCAMLGVKPCCQNPVYLLARPGTCMWASDPAHSCLLLHSGAALGTLTKSPGCEWQWLLCYPVQEPMPVPWRVGARSQPCARQAGQPRGPGARNLSPHTLLAWEEGRLRPRLLGDLVRKLRQLPPGQTQCQGSHSEMHVGSSGTTCSEDVTPSGDIRNDSESSRPGRQSP